MIIEIDNKVIMVPRGDLSGFMALVDPNLYQKYIITGTNVKLVLYVRLQRNIYG